jgi:heme oxygenase
MPERAAPGGTPKSAHAEVFPPLISSQSGDRGAQPGARWFLRTEIRELHEQAERTLGDEPIAKIEDYIAMLQANLAMTEAVLDAVAAHLPSSTTRDLRMDRARLLSDIKALGAEPRYRCESLVFASRSAALGALYVCEGARLGGRVLAKHAGARLGLSARHGAAYLNGSGDQGARWHAFLALLDDELVAQSCRDHAVEAARQVFELIIRLYGETECRTP